MTSPASVLRGMLLREEGKRLKVYDDATGKELVPGETLVGHPTIGIGRALDTEGITNAECDYLLSNDIEVVQAQAAQSFFWYPPLSDVRKAVVLSMLFQLGLAGVKDFHDFAAAMARLDWRAAHDAMLDSKWAKTDSPARASRLAKQLLTDQEQQ